MGMRTLLIDNSAYNHTNLRNREQRACPELYYSPGILSIAAYLRAAGEAVEYLSLADVDEGRVDERSLLAAIERADVFGINAYTPNVERAATLCARAKSIKPAIVTVLGGNHPTALDVETLLTYPRVDVVVRDEGEQTLLELMRRGGDPTGILGTTCRGPHGVVRNPPRPLLAPDEIVEPAYDLLPFPLQRYLICISTQRGCSNRCAFCAEGRPLGRLRQRPVERVGDELARVTRELSPGARIYFADSIFVSDEERVRALCDRVRALNRGFAIGCNLYCTNTSVPTVDALASAGFNLFFVGFESRSSEVLEAAGRLRRGASFEANVAMCELVHERSDALVRSNWIVGLPGATHDTIEADVATMVELVRDGTVDYAVVKNLIPYPGTDVHSTPAAYGVEIVSRVWSEYSREERPVYRLPELSPDDILDHRVRARARVQSAYESRTRPISDGLRRSVRLWDLPGMKA